MPLAFSEVRAGVAGVCAAVVVVGCVAAGCGSDASGTQGPTGENVRQECVDAVFGVLSGMIERPYDNRPFQDFVTRYGTGSVTYSAYLDVFSSFYSLSASQGVHAAEARLRSTVTRDCAASS
jgi:hypothetical protein